MALKKIIGFSTGGLNTDTPPYDLPDNMLTTAKNFRCDNKTLTSNNIFSKTFALKDNAPIKSIYITSEGGGYWVIVNKTSITKILASEMDVTPDSYSAGSGPIVSVAALADIPIVNNSGTKPYFMLPSSAKFMPLPWDKSKDWAAANQTCDVMVSHKQFLFALSITDNGIHHPTTLRWSHPADVGAVPVSWDPTDTTKAAGITTLGGNGGNIIAALPMRDSLVIYRSNGISIADYVGGQYVWKIRHVQTGVGILTPDAVADVNGLHFFVSNGEVYSFDGNSIFPIANDRVAKQLNQIDEQSIQMLFVVHDQTDKSVMIFMPINNAKGCNLCLIYNYASNAWTTIEVPPTKFAGYGTIAGNIKTWDASTGSWDEAGNTWEANTSAPSNKTVVTISTEDDSAYNLLSLKPINGFENLTFNSIIERTDLSIGEPEHVSTIQRIYPYISGVGKVNFQVGSQMYPGAPVLWKPVQVFDINNERKIDIRTTGLYHAFRISSDGSSSYSISGLAIEYIDGGTR